MYWNISVSLKLFSNKIFEKRIKWRMKRDEKKGRCGYKRAVQGILVVLEKVIKFIKKT